MLKMEKTARTLFSKSSGDGSIKYDFNRARMQEIVDLNNDICFFIMLWLHRFYWRRYSGKDAENNISTGLPIQYCLDRIKGAIYEI